MTRIRTRQGPPPHLGALCLMALATLLPAQADMRDVVRLTNGQEIQGRVYERHEQDQVLILQGNKRVRVPQARVAEMVTVRDHMRDFFERRDRLPDNPRYRWILVEWALSRGLTSLAHLQAIDVVLHDGDHEQARALLGHRKFGNQWRWPRKDQWFTLEALEESTANWGRALELEGETFLVRTTAGMRRAVDTVFDLERLYVWWMDSFGGILMLREVVSQKLPVHIWSDHSSFPAWTSFEAPYFRPRSGDATTAWTESASYTWFAPESQRAVRLFEVATHHLIYRTLGEDSVVGTVKDRIAPWAEVGLGQYVDRRFSGPPGRATVGPWQIRAEEATLVQTERSYGLEILTHRPAKAYFVTVASNTALDWASAHLFVAFLMDEDVRPRLRDGFFDYLYEAHRRAKSASSTALDRALGRQVGTLEAPWRKWIEEKRSQLPVVAPVR